MGIGHTWTIPSSGLWLNLDNLHPFKATCPIHGCPTAIYLYPPINPATSMGAHIHLPISPQGRIQDFHRGVVQHISAAGKNGKRTKMQDGSVWEAANLSPPPPQPLDPPHPPV